jgi:long-subunit fatty acid transport protein
MRSGNPDTRSRTSTDSAGGAARWVIRFARVVFLGFPFMLNSGTTTLIIPVPGGTVNKDINWNSAGVPSGMTQPQNPNSVPLIFSAPLPSGSGARALGLAGAFTAVADDATAASWNPAGLTQLERPELSIVYRYSHERDLRSIGDSDYHVGEDDFDANNINYMSAVMPFRLFDRNMVVSLNYQEVFDFSQYYHANYIESGSEDRPISAYTDPENPLDPNKALRREIPVTPATFPFNPDPPNTFYTITPHLYIQRTYDTKETVTHTSANDVQFEQEGSVQAITPAFAFDLTPKLSLGAALNVYQAGLLNTPNIHSKTRARYAGSLDRTVGITKILYGSYVDAKGKWNGNDIDLIDLFDKSWEEIPTGPEASEVTHYTYSGLYEVEQRISQYRGLNATLGSLLTVSEQLTLGFNLDLPWKAHARQTTTARSEFEMWDSNGVSLGKFPGTSQTSKDVEFEYPLYWALGSVWRWNNRLSTSFDVSQTWWSDYSFKEEGGTRKNPLDGSDHGEHPLDDCWSLRTGTEYLWVLKRTEIPLRGGLSWEQRPAIGKPDDYWGISLGTGISIGKGPNKVIIDIAYTYTWANSVMGSLVPDKDIGSDVQRHDVYVSCIYHF